MSRLFKTLCFFVIIQLRLMAPTEAYAFSYNFQLNLERSALDGLSLDDDADENRLVEQDLELEFGLEYSINDDTYLFFTGAIIDESETIDSAGIDEEVSGFERKRIGLGYFFGEEIRSEFNIGRMEFSSRSDWFLWWDEELDGLRLETTYENFDLMLGLTEEQARESTGVDFIDPEQESVQRRFFSLDWEVTAGHSLIIYHLQQSDNSEPFDIGETTDAEKTDEEDADLSWRGLSYFGELALSNAGLFEFEAHWAEVSGSETIYEFDDPSAGLSEVVEKQKNRVIGTAHSYLVNWTPDFLQDWRFFAGNARGSGDNSPGNARVSSFRQPGLQDDAEAYGDLYQPELSNLEVDVVGLNWEPARGVSLTVSNYIYRQRKLADDMRDVSIVSGPSGLSRALGRETDIVVIIEADNGLEFILTAAEFKAGKAYAGAAARTSSYINLELAYEF